MVKESGVYIGTSKSLLALKVCVPSWSEWQSLVVRMDREEVQSQGLTDLARTGRENWISSKLHTMKKEHC
jgi:hypothetical protein